VDKLVPSWLDGDLWKDDSIVVVALLNYNKVSTVLQRSLWTAIKYICFSIYAAVMTKKHYHRLQYSQSEGYAQVLTFTDSMLFCYFYVSV